MARVALVLALLLVPALAACGVADKLSTPEALAQAAKATSGLGMHITSTGTVTVAGQELPVRLRMAIAPSGRIKIDNDTAGTKITQYIDANSMVMSVDGLPSTDGLPKGTRYIRMDLEKIRQAEGIDSGVQDLQTMDPTKVLEGLSKLTDVDKLGPATDNGVAVTRYHAKLTMSELAKAIDADHKVPALPKQIRDSVIDMVVSIDGDDHLRGFTETATIGPITMDLKSEVTSFDRDLQVEMPSGGGIVDVTGGVVDSLGALPK